jgi:hypothetical protein
MRIAPGFIRVISSPNTYTPSLLQQASGSPQDEGYFPIIIRVIFKFVLIREIRGPYPPEQRAVIRMKLPSLVADHPERLHVACLQDTAELGPVAGGWIWATTASGKSIKQTEKYILFRILAQIQMI